MRELTHPFETLESILESLIIHYRYAGKSKRFILVTEFHKKAPGAGKTFLKLVFESVTGFTREKGIKKDFSIFTKEYSTQDASGSIVVQAVKPVRKKGRLGIELWFGPSFGGLSFECASAAGIFRDAIVKNQDGNFLYFDQETGKPVRFSNPFGRR